MFPVAILDASAQTALHRFGALKPCDCPAFEHAGNQHVALPAQTRPQIQPAVAAYQTVASRR